MRDAVFWILGSGVLVGVVGGLLLSVDWWTVLWLYLLACGCIFVGYTHRVQAAGILCAVALAGVAFGVARAHLSPEPYSELLSRYIEKEIYLEGTIISEPDTRERTVLLTVTPKQIGETLDDMRVVSNVHTHVLVSVRAPASFSYGDTVHAHGTLVYPEPFETDTGRVFDYPNFLSVRGIGYSMPLAEVVVTETGGGWWLFSALSYVRSTYLYGLEQSLVEPHAALAGGITVGDKRALGGELTETFQIVGLSHIVVLSGYNITIVSDVIMRILGGLSRGLASGIGGIVIILFVIMSGASAAAVRAGIMACVVLIARVTHRPAAASRALMVAVLLMIVYEPRILLYDPGFQLSVIATLGLVYIAPLIAQRLRWVPERFALREIVAATVGTQFAVAPLLLYQTGLFSLVSLPVNLLVLPIVPAAMFASFIAGVVGSMSHVAGVVLGAPAYVLLEYMLLVAETAAALPAAAVSAPLTSLTVLMGIYVLLIGAVWFMRQHRSFESVVLQHSN